jgi:alkyl sulfatase BDS1-like metallo-beta-lactamase superfamily hydrolase
VSHAVPSIYDGNIGWFEGDPVVLQATPRVEYAKRTVKIMGGREKVLAEARSAFASGDAQFAAELATLLIRIDNTDMDARRLKAAAFRKQGYTTINSTWRGLYLTLANTLDGKMDWSPILAANRSRYSSAAMAESMPARMMLDVLPGRLKAEAALDVEQVVGFRFTDTGEALTVSIRRGIAEVREGEAAAGTLTINGTRAAMARALADGGATLPESLQVAGSRDAAQKFLALFEPAFGGVPDFYLR